MLETLLKQWSAQSRTQSAVLCSVIEWKGSVPRKDYPIMLVMEDGSIIGTIGGGSMEFKVTQVAEKMFGKTQAGIYDFDMTGTDVQADIGLCGGTLKVLVEPFSVELQTFYTDMLKQYRNNYRLMVLLSMTDGNNPSVQRRIIKNRQEFSELNPDLRHKLQQIYENQQTRALTSFGQHYLMWQPFTPPTIHIFGAGHVGQSVASLAHFNDQSVIVYDDRMELLTTARFPFAKRITLKFPIAWKAVPRIPDRDFILIASREHKHDHELLKGLLKTIPAYIGLVSSARKWKILSESLLQEGLPIDSVSAVHAPVGLNIDAQTVPEIAISIMSEIIAEYRSTLH